MYNLHVHYIGIIILLNRELIVVVMSYVDSIVI